MLRHNLLIIFRNFKRDKSSFFINLIGLSTGLACVLLIYLWVNDELNFDSFHRKNKQLFQVMENQYNTNGIVTTNETPGLLAEALAAEMPEIKYAVCATDPAWYSENTLSVEDKIVRANGIFASQDYFNVLTYELIEGDKNAVLIDKNSIVISHAMAMKLFNTTENIIGKTIKWQEGNRKNEVAVSGIFKDIPPNTSVHFDYVLSFKLHEELEGGSRWNTWDNFTATTYVILRQGADINQLNAKIFNFVKSKTKYSNVTLFLKRYSEKYLYGKYENGVLVGGRIEYVRLFSLIAIIILIIACINFMNLSTARASRRMKEIGIKKTLGADRKSLVIQHLGESILMAILSLTVAIVLVELLLPQFNEITGKHIILNLNASVILSIVGITLFTGLTAGSYPALYLSGFNPATVLKGKFHSSIGELWTRNGLVVFQFALSSILIVAVLVVYKQIEFVQTKNLGYDKDNIIYFDKDGRFTEDQNLGTFLSEVKRMPEVVNASSIAHSMVKSENYTTGLFWDGKNPNEILRFESMYVDYDMIETLGIEMKEGRTFSREFGSDNSAIVFDEAAITAMGLKNPVGKVINLWGRFNLTIIGVTKNFHFESLHENVKPAFFWMRPQWTKYIMVRIKAGMEKEAVQKIQKLYAQFNPGLTFDYKFLDQSYQAQYAAETRVAVLSRYFAGLAILISCLGLFGLAAFTAERRRKEIGVRKVLGSSELGIITLLTNDFTRVVFASMLISLPVGYFITKHWLDSFAYRIDLQVWYFIGAGLITLFIAWITVAAQAIKAATANPVEALRYE
jgi:putative ABC transport system permease protein